MMANSHLSKLEECRGLYNDELYESCSILTGMLISLNPAKDIHKDAKILLGDSLAHLGELARAALCYECALELNENSFQEHPNQT
jgi:hypothetical protein